MFNLSAETCTTNRNSNTLKQIVIDSEKQLMGFNGLEFLTNNAIHW